jgi:hypothetical protein
MGCPMSRFFCETWESRRLGPTSHAATYTIVPVQLNQRATDNYPASNYDSLAARAEPSLG